MLAKIAPCPRAKVDARQIEPLDAAHADLQARCHLFDGQGGVWVDGWRKLFVRHIVVSGRACGGWARLASRRMLRLSRQVRSVHDQHRRGRRGGDEFDGVKHGERDAQRVGF